MHKKYIAITVVVVIIIGIAAFYGGMQYNKIKLASQALIRGNNTAGYPGGMRQGAAQGGQRMGGGGNNSNVNFVAGEILSKDDKSITVKTRDGGSKIIYYSDSTTVGKTVDGSASDLYTGQQIMATGKIDPSGSVSADNIQIRPADQKQPGQ